MGVFRAALSLELLGRYRQAQNMTYSPQMGLVRLTSSPMIGDEVMPTSYNITLPFPTFLLPSLASKMFV